MHTINQKDYSITSTNKIIYTTDNEHWEYRNLEKKLFCLRNNDLMKLDIFTFNFDRLMKKEAWFDFVCN
jgi:hypothetical protein